MIVCKVIHPRCNVIKSHQLTFCNMPEIIAMPDLWVLFAHQFCNAGMSVCHKLCYDNTIILRKFQANHRIQDIKLCKKTKFLACIANSFQVIEGNPVEDWAKYPSLKIAFGGIFWVGSVYHRIQHIALCLKTFQVHIAKIVQVTEGNPIEGWSLVSLF